jgi:competence protein ComEC
MDALAIRKTILLLLCAAVFVVYSLSAYDGQFFSFRTDTCTPGLLCVHFLDVGQGDAVFIESPSGMQILIDGGPGPAVLRELGSAMRFFDRDIDLIIATHPDKDHIGGLVDVLKRYTVHAVLLTENKSETPVSDMFEALVEEEDAQLFYARSGQRYDIGGAFFTVFFPDRDATLFETNTASIILKLSYGEIDFLFTGDAPQSVEKYLVAAYSGALASEVLKVGHHGSKTSTAETFVSAVSPQYAVISAGRDNTYGHPHSEVLDVLDSLQAAVYGTYDEGRISFETDGTNVVRSR